MIFVVEYLTKTYYVGQLNVIFHLILRLRAQNYIVLKKMDIFLFPVVLHVPYLPEDEVTD